MRAPGQCRVIQHLFERCKLLGAACQRFELRPQGCQQFVKRIGLCAMLARHIVKGAQSLLSCPKPLRVELHGSSKACCLSLRLIELNQR